MKEGEHLWNFCPDCLKSTHHTIQKVFKLPGSMEYQVDRFYAVVQCDGCHEVSYRTETKDYELMDYDHQSNDYEPRLYVYTYPETLAHEPDKVDTALLPDKIRMVYQDIIRAFTAKSYLLTAIGFRTIIEAICINQGIKVKDNEDLKPQIDKMVQKGLITPREGLRLHTIRFSGNDAAHEMAVPREEDLYVVLNIVDHLLNNLYIIDSQIKGGLEKVVTDFNGLRLLLSTALSNFKIDDSLSLNRILGKSARRLHDNGAALERQLIDKIKVGEYSKLALGDLHPHQDDKLPPVQYYIVKDITWDTAAGLSFT